MSFKRFALDASTPITIYKRKASRSLRLSVTPQGDIRMTIPTWAPYMSGLQFARSHLAWIQSQRRQGLLLAPGQAVGKAHHLTFVSDPGLAKTLSRVKTGEVLVMHPVLLRPADPEVQAVAGAASIRALRGQAKQLLPHRLQTLAAQHDFSYSEVTIKLLKSRWGSCDQHRNIVLNLFLMQLPWELIDYVLLHELTHTQVLHHGPDFWQALERVLPDCRRLRKVLRGYQPILHGSAAQAVS